MDESLTAERMYSVSQNSVLPASTPGHCATWQRFYSYPYLWKSLKLLPEFFHVRLPQVVSGLL
eukprot:scaffold982_cov139-Cylindrotheca_fusiformis.AAC.3